MKILLPDFFQLLILNGFLYLILTSYNILFPGILGFIKTIIIKKIFSDINMEDLRKHVQYYGGFHNNHRVIKWLWSIVQNDFSATERHLFLKVCFKVKKFFFSLLRVVLELPYWVFLIWNHHFRFVV